MEYVESNLYGQGTWILWWFVEFMVVYQVIWTQYQYSPLNQAHFDRQGKGCTGEGALGVTLHDVVPENPGTL